ncbi:MAG: hypothetical protein KKG14_06325 [Alphaproteobacteria bacterium]|nr:hypothetical protein [Alphaproteobacteria bacterium]MBU2272153.1 hypothetical protein [Alphaproteobacteria bacterium]MBU2418297.1 hypothetical protein [Alphaproteobacteria bacterium]
MISTLALVASLAIQEVPEQTTLLPGVVDLPLLTGSRADPSCAGETAINPGAGLACVASTGGDLTELQARYAEAAIAIGWRFSFIGRDVVFLERPVAGGRCEMLSFNPIGDHSGDEGYAPTGLAMLLDRDMPCIQGRGE